MNNRNGPSWKAVLMLIGGTIAICVTVAWATLTNHANQPHKDAVAREELAIYMRETDRRLESIDNTVKDLYGWLIKEADKAD